MDHVAMEDALGRIGAGMRAHMDEATPDAERAVLVIGRVGYTGSVKLDVFAGGDRISSRMGHIRENDISDLRDAAHEADRGSWFTAVIELTADGRISVDFDYDNDPDLGIPIDRRALERERSEWPRSREHIPAWLQARYDEEGL